MRLAIITTHPIQYNAPLFAMLQQRNNIKIKVFYTWGPTVLKDKFDPGFGKKIDWDIPLLEGYDHEFVTNIAPDPGSHHFKGIDNPGLIDAIKNWKANAILIYGWAFKSHLKTMRYFHKRVPVFFRGDSTSLQYKHPLKQIVRSFFLRWVYRHVDVALYVGTHNKNYYKDIGIKETALVFAPHAVDNARFKNECKINSEKTMGVKSSMGIETSDIVILYAGKLDENKNVKLLLDVFCSSQRIGSHLVIAGNGIMEKDLINSYGKEKNVHFLPFQNQSMMPQVYAMADIFVLPSLSETWGLSINEAMACEKAVLVSSACGAAIDLVKPGENGYIFNSNDRDDLRQHLTQMLAGKNLLIKMGLRSGEIISSWTYEKTCEQIEELMNSIHNS